MVMVMVMVMVMALQIPLLEKPNSQTLTLADALNNMNKLAAAKIANALIFYLLNSTSRHSPILEK